MLTGRIAKAVMGSLLRQGQHRALGAIGIRGWKMHLFRAVQNAVRQGRDASLSARRPPRDKG